MSQSSDWAELSVDAAADLLAARVTVIGLRTKRADNPMPSSFGQAAQWLDPRVDPATWSEGAIKGRGKRLVATK